MDHWFDDLSRTLAGGVSRRQALRRLGGGLLGAALASLIPQDAAAEAGRECASLCNRLPPGAERGVCHSGCTYQLFLCGGDPSRLCVGPGGQITCCRPGHVCVAGACVCPPGTTTCGSACCAAGSACLNGVCLPITVCPPGIVACGGRCCPQGMVCSGGQCSCPDGTSLCGLTTCCPNIGFCDAGQCIAPPA